MRTQTIKIIICLAATFGLISSAYPQVVRFRFTSEVTQISGPLLPGVSVGSIISGQVEVDLAHFPTEDANEGLVPYSAFYSYAGQGRPGYIFQFDTGLQTFTFDSVNAGADLGVGPGVSLANGPDADYFDLAARDQGNLFGVVLGFADITAPFTLLGGLYFPEDVNLAAGLERGEFRYADFINTNAVVAKVTSASMEIDQDTPSALLIYRVNASNLSASGKRLLLAKLEAADAAFANGQCATGLRYLQAFQNKVRAQIAKTDPVLAAHLVAGAQAIIDSGCGN